MAESLKDLLNWARHVDHGIRQLEYYVERNGIDDNQLNPNEVMQKFQEIIEDARETKLSAQKDVDKLKCMSDELKELIVTTESEEVMQIDDELKIMLNKLFPATATVTVEESPPAVEVSPSAIDAVQRINVDVNSLEPIVEASVLTPIPNTSPNPEESYTVVEITPGLGYKIPKSRLESGDISSSSERLAYSLLRPIRKKTLIFSPSENTNRSSMSPITETNAAQIVVQDSSNRNTRKVEGNTKHSDVTLHEPVDSPEILERPKRPVLTSVLYGLLD